MKYRDLLIELQLLSPEQLNQDVTVLVREQDEYYPLVPDYPWLFAESDVLDQDHPYLVI